MVILKFAIGASSDDTTSMISKKHVSMNRSICMYNNLDRNLIGSIPTCIMIFGRINEIAECIFALKNVAQCSFVSIEIVTEFSSKISVDNKEHF